MTDYVCYKLIVREDEACERLLKYLNKNITIIKRLGARVRISKIEADLDKETVERLRDEGIVRLPALVDPSGNKIIGLKKIIELFEHNINKNKPGATKAERFTDNEFGENPALNDFYMQELFAGRDQTTGKMIARKDKDEADDENVGNDMQRRMAEYRAPAHRTGKQDRNDHHNDDNNNLNDDRAPPTRNRGSERRNNDYPDDNIADEPPPRQRAQPPPVDGDEIEQRMWATMFDNITGDL